MKIVLLQLTVLASSILIINTAVAAIDFCAEDLTWTRLTHCNFDVSYGERIDGQCVTPPSTTLRRMEIFMRGNGQKRYGSAQRVLSPPYFGPVGNGGCIDSVRQNSFCDTHERLRVRDIGKNVRRIYSRFGGAPMITIHHRNRRVSTAVYNSGSSPAYVIAGTCTKG